MKYLEFYLYDHNSYEIDIYILGLQREIFFGVTADDSLHL